MYVLAFVILVVFGVVLFATFTFLSKRGKIPIDSKLLKKRSKGVLIIAILLTLDWVWEVISPKAHYTTLDFLHLTQVSGGFLCGIGLMRLKEWARKLTILVAIFGLIMFVAYYFRRDFSMLPSSNDPLYMPAIISIYLPMLFAFLYSGIVIYFLTRSKIKEQFKTLA